MIRDNERHKHFNRRTLLLAGGKAVLLSALVGRMYYLQVVEADRYKTLAEENRINLHLLAPPRGRIVDRLGIPLADNQQNYRVLLISEDAPDVAATLDILSQIIPIGDRDRRRILRDTKRKRSFVSVTVRENLNWEQVAKIEFNAPDLPGVMIDVGRSRDYPFGQEIAHVLGYVAAVSPKDRTGDPLLEIPGFRVGRAGLEKIHETRLRGRSGSSQVEVNAFGRVIRELSRQEGQPGLEVGLTIDVGLQRVVSEQLGDESAASVVIDVHSGDILAMASTPSFDPNLFNTGLSGKDWRALINNPKSPLINKTIAGRYSPGSTFKMVVLLAALEKGVIGANNTVFCPGYFELGNTKFHCWRKHGHGMVNAKRALVESCDIYFYEISKRTGIKRIAEMARRFGMGERLGVDLPGEQAGLVPTPKWKRGALDAPWQLGETVISGIGQGYLLATPLQLAVMTARLANGGMAVKPRLTRALPGAPEEKKFENLGLTPQHLTLVRAAMGDVVNQRTGTAFRSKITEPGMEMAGKTGTVQVRRISRSERDKGVIKNKDLPWKERDHSLFVGFAPVHGPRYAVAVVIEHGGSGSKLAAPIGAHVLRETQKRLLSGDSDIAVGAPEKSSG